MTNRIYIIEKLDIPSSNQIINNTINQYNTINNFVSSMDTIEKLTKYTDFKKINIIGFDQSIEDKFTKTAKRLENNEYKYGFHLKSDDFLDIINDISMVCNAKSVEEFNMHYDNRFNRIKIFEEGTWEEFLLCHGVKRILGTVQEHFLNFYELYLVRNIIESANYKKQEWRELLDEYYKFIGCFDVEPSIKGKSDNEIMGIGSEDSYEISDTYMKMYQKIQDGTTRLEVKNTKKEVVDVIKRNTIRNVDEMNKKVVELFNMDEDFKKTLLQKCA
jgi:hypothetical protein